MVEMLVWIFLGILVVAAVLGISYYNRFVRLKTLVLEAWSGVDVMLKQRYDLIPNLVETVKGYAAHEQGTLQQVTEARTQAMRAVDVPQQQAAEQNLTRALGGLFAVAEQYPDLKANHNFLQLQEQLARIEGDLEKARRYYNGTVRENNILVQTFPSNIVANIFNFSTSNFFELDSTSERETPKVAF
ncbi:MAG: LemA family protein [Weeksellaceae bacterium]|nr:LemA family protein [Weeksellaceae bacterium]